MAEAGENHNSPLLKPLEVIGGRLGNVRSDVLAIGASNYGFRVSRRTATARYWLSKSRAIQHN
jgi:hypothetical protein